MARYHGISTLADVIERLESTPYMFSGHYWDLSSPSLKSHLEFHCEFTHDIESLIADSQDGSFHMRIPFKGMPLHGALVELFFRDFGDMPGQLTFSDGNVIFAGHNETAALFAHICFDDRNAITIAGMLELTNRKLAYSLNGSREIGPTSIADVVPIRKRS